MDVNISKKLKEGLFRTILDTVSDGVTVMDNDLKIQYQNKINVQLFGSRIGEYCYKVYRGRKEPCNNCMVLEVLKDGKERRDIKDILLPGDNILLLETSSAAIKDAEGNIIGAVEVARDVTDQKKAEALLNKTLLERNEDLKQLNNELSDATGYVKAVLPQKINTGELLIDWRFIPSASLGGDSFGYHWIDDDHFALYLIDVSGHGWAAALLSVSVINALRSHSLPKTDFRDPESVLISLNHAFPSEKHNDMFFTIWYGIYQKSSGTLTYSSGGHPPALLIIKSSNRTNELIKLKTSGFVVGGKSNAKYTKKTLKIPYSSRLLLFSDGVYELTRSDGTIWGLKKFLTFIEQTSPQNGSYLDLIIEYTKSLTPNESFDDDITILEILFN
jgi:serine phosphatase RsbU (regulator of sigma subunit)